MVWNDYPHLGGSIVDGSKAFAAQIFRLEVYFQSMKFYA